MISKLNCPFCQTELEQTNDKKMLGCPKCLHIADGALWQALIQSRQDLEESQQATIQNAKTVLEIHKDLEIATKALEKLNCEYNRCRNEEFDGVDIDWVWWAMAAKNVVETALNQIEHKEV